MDTESTHHRLARTLSGKARVLVAVLLICGAGGLFHLAVTSGATAKDAAAVQVSQPVRAEQHRRAVFEERRRTFEASKARADKAAQARE